MMAILEKLISPSIRASRTLFVHIACLMLAVGPVLDGAARISIIECEEMPSAPPGENEEETPTSEMTTERGASPVRFLRLTYRPSSIQPVSRKTHRLIDLVASLPDVPASPNPILRC
jgi:hypothetical protein